MTAPVVLPIPMLRVRLDAADDAALDAICKGHAPELNRSAMVRALIHREKLALDARTAESELLARKVMRMGQLATGRKGMLPGQEVKTGVRFCRRLDLDGNALEESPRFADDPTEYQWRRVRNFDHERLETVSIMRRHDGTEYEKRTHLREPPTWELDWIERGQGLDTTRRQPRYWTEADARAAAAEIDPKLLVSFRIHAPSDRQCAGEKPIPPMASRIEEPARVPGLWLLAWRASPHVGYDKQTFARESDMMAAMYALPAGITDAVFLEPA